MFERKKNLLTPQMEKEFLETSITKVNADEDPYQFQITLRPNQTRIRKIKRVSKRRREAPRPEDLARLQPSYFKRNRNAFMLSAAVLLWMGAVMALISKSAHWKPIKEALVEPAKIQEVLHAISVGEDGSITESAAVSPEVPQPQAEAIEPEKFELVGSRLEAPQETKFEFELLPPPPKEVREALSKPYKSKALANRKPARSARRK